MLEFHIILCVVDSELCVQQDDGYYVDPENCAGFIECENGRSSSTGYCNCTGYTYHPGPGVPRCAYTRHGYYQDPDDCGEYHICMDLPGPFTSRSWPNKLSCHTGDGLGFDTGYREGVAPTCYPKEEVLGCDEYVGDTVQ